jgi:pilus assembly protein CpaF
MTRSTSSAHRSHTCSGRTAITSPGAVSAARLDAVRLRLAESGSEPTITGVAGRHHAFKRSSSAPEAV